jgi:hypothetical protein
MEIEGGGPGQCLAVKVNRQVECEMLNLNRVGVRVGVFIAERGWG